MTSSLGPERFEYNKKKGEIFNARVEEQPNEAIWIKDNSEKTWDGVIRENMSHQ